MRYSCSLDLGGDSAMDSIYNRRSIRKFQQKDVPLEIINRILNAGRVAPSAKNRQPWKYIVFGNEKKQEFLEAMEAGLAREERGITDLPKFRFGIPDAKNTLRIMREAPIIIVVLNTNGKSPFAFPLSGADERITEICDSLAIGASVENMLLAADEMGLGSLWIANTCFAYRELVSYLDTDYQLVGAVAIGYADEQPSERPRKGLDEIAEYRV